MTVRELGRRLGISSSPVSRLVRKGMPLEEVGARTWRLQYVRARRCDRQDSASNTTDAPSVQDPADVCHNSGTETKVVEFEEPSIAEGLDASLARLRELERSAAVTLRKLLKEGRIAEAASMRAQHASILRSLFDAEAKALKLAERREELIPMERALRMISIAFSETVILLRQLPSLGRDEAEKAGK